MPARCANATRNSATVCGFQPPHSCSSTSVAFAPLVTEPSRHKIATVTVATILDPRWLMGARQGCGTQSCLPLRSASLVQFLRCAISAACQCSRQEMRQRHGKSCAQPCAPTAQAKGVVVAFCLQAKRAKHLQLPGRLSLRECRIRIRCSDCCRDTQCQQAANPPERRAPSQCLPHRQSLA